MAQIPIGSIPISGGNQAPTTTAVRRFDLDAYATKHLHYRFYFPSVGTFSSYPAQALREDHIVASCPQAPIVVAVPVEPVKTNDWRDLAKNGSVKEILDYLDTHNPSRLDLRVLSARLKEKPFYETMVGWFRSHALPENTIFKFGFVHNDVAAIKDFLRWNRVGGLDLGFELTSPLLSVRRHSDRTFEHVELDPVINPRAHLVSGKRVLGGDQVLDFYRAALNSLSYRRALDDEDRLELAYHLFLQDRVGEALNLFAKVDRDKLVTKLQYDYFKAYALFYEGKVAGAEAIAKKHATHPVEHWRKRFETVLAHAAETRMVVGGDEAPEAKPGEKGPVAAEILHREPMLDATMVGDAVQITHANMESCTMGIYVMNLEFLFSKNPFIDRDHGHFLHMRPNHSMPVSLDKSGKTRVEIPKDYRNKHLLIELSGAGKRVVQTHVASGLVAYVEQNHGEVKVVDTAGKPVSAAYVKVYFSGTDGGAAFYKDGYTDLRGRFNYAALNSSKAGDNPITRVSRFAILVTAPNKGSLVKEVGPPTGVDSEEDPFGEDLDGGLDDGGLDDGGLNDDAW